MAFIPLHSEFYFLNSRCLSILLYNNLSNKILLIQTEEREKYELYGILIE